MNTTTIFSEGWINIVFDGRNKAYGAYELRRIADRTLLLAALFSTALLAGALSIALLKGAADGGEKGNKVFTYTDTTTFTIPPLLPEEHKQKTLKDPPKPRVQDANSFEIVADTTAIEPPDTTQNINNMTEGEDTTGEMTASSGGGIPGDSEDNNTGFDNKQNNEVKDWAEIMPRFPGGPGEFSTFMKDHLKYPDLARENDIEGTVGISFVVEKDGSITQVSVARGVHRWLDEEALRVVKLMPAWEPGRQNGRAVRVRYNLPIKFTL